MSEGKALYQPKGKAREYSKWAVNFYNGCSARCKYCYNRKGITAKILGGNKPVLKKSLVNEDEALKIFISEALNNMQELQRYGLFFNFVSDPFLPETKELNMMAMKFCIVNDIPVKVLTKQTAWVHDFISEATSAGTQLNRIVWNAYRLFAFGFTLTGHDSLEPGAATNQERIAAMKWLKHIGFRTWASLEPIIDFDTTFGIYQDAYPYCDLFRIGIQSGKKYDGFDAMKFVRAVQQLNAMSQCGKRKIYFKDSLLHLAGIDRASLPDFCVDRDYIL